MSSHVTHGASLGSLRSERPRGVVRFLPWLSAALLIGLFALAAWARFRLPLAPLADPDVWCYVNPGLTKLLGGPFQHTYGQCFLYPGLIYLVLAACGDWRAITVVQHLFGLGTGALLLVAWRQVRGFLPAPRLPRFLYDLAGLAMAGAYLLALSPIRFEHTLRPEAVFPFFALLNICLNLAFIRHRFGGTNGTRPPSPDWRGVATGAGAVFACVMAFLLKPSFSAMLLLANLPVLWSLFAPGRAWRDKLTLAVVSVLMPGVLLLWPERQFRLGDPDAHSFLAASLFTVHAGLIRDQMAADLAQHHTAPYNPAWLETVRTRLTQDLRASTRTGKYPSLGYDPDFLKRATSFDGWLVKQIGDRERTSNFYDDYYRRTWRGRPLAMGRKIWRQLRIFYQFGKCPAYSNYDHRELTASYARSAQMFDPHGPLFDPDPAVSQSTRAEENRAAAKAYVARCAVLGTESHADVDFPGVEAAAQLFSITYLPLCAWALLLGAGAWALPTVRRWAGGAAGVLLLLYADNFGTTLSLSIGHSMEVGRYSIYQLAYTLLPQSADAVLAVEAALAAAALVAVRYGALFAARPEPLPTLAEPGEYEVWTEPDGGSAGLDSAETAHALVRAYAESPADLITARRTVAVGPVAGFVRWAVGVNSGTPVADGRLLSGRLRRSVPQAASEREVAVLAAGRGFLTREISLPGESVSPGRRDVAARWREGARLGLLCCRCRPWRVLGTVAAVCLGLAAAAVVGSLHRPPHARHRYATRRNPVRAAQVLAATAVGSLWAAGILEARRRRWRAAFLQRAGN